ncbi:uncharacterized protein LOC141648720 [Silene latifolia]|uniref:uncharacterized protein LOC141648720 n=1 Tax=Silene latifolia TaxID=37657 RepID=UPI003D788421
MGKMGLGELLVSTGGHQLQIDIFHGNYFKSLVSKLMVHGDVEFEGYEFTFDNGQEEGDNRQSTLDRALCNDAWNELFLRSILRNLDREWSDHAPIKLVMNRRGETERGVNKVFRFEQIWISENGCEDVVKEAWTDGEENLVENLTRCAENLQRWKGTSIGKIVRDLNTKRRKLLRLNEGGRTGWDVRERKRLVKDITNLIHQEEIFWRQRLRALWLKDGDRNTAYFHRKAGQRKKRNHIAKLIDEEGREYVGFEAVQGAAKGYFERLFKSGSPSNFEPLLEGIAGRVTDRMNGFLRSEYTIVEVEMALNQMHPLKAPGPDDMNGLLSNLLAYCWKIGD